MPFLFLFELANNIFFHSIKRKKSSGKKSPTDIFLANMTQETSELKYVQTRHGLAFQFNKRPLQHTAQQFQLKTSFE